MSDDLLSSGIGAVLALLHDYYGPPEPREADDILGTLVRTILSQQTTNANAERAFGNLLDAFEGDWHQVAKADPEALTSTINVAGLARQKGTRIQGLLRRIHSETGSYDLEFLASYTPNDARDYLCNFKGVGPKTASFTLMIASEMDLFPMDTHILRLCRRMEWISASGSDADAHAIVEPAIEEADRYTAHVLMVQHGRQICHARRPQCGECPLLKICPHGQNQDPAR